MLQINGKTFMNLQEAVQWLLDNNALPFQSSANYVANTEIGMGTIVNPSPAKVRIGSLIFFADSKVSTVIGLTENGFICSDQYNDLVDDVVYVANVQLNASGHLIVTLSNGDTIDAGLVKQVSGFSINASQHLIVSFNDGNTNDLGAIFTGNVNISGALTAQTIEQSQPNASFSYTGISSSIGTLTDVYNRLIVINNVAYFILNIKATATSGTASADSEACSPSITISSSIASKIVDLNGKTALEDGNSQLITCVPCSITKGTNYDATRYKATLCLTNQSWEGGINLRVRLDEAITKEEGVDYYIMARIALTLL